jgi:hypothetical protein
VNGIDLLSRHRHMRHGGMCHADYAIVEFTSNTEIWGGLA